MTNPNKAHITLVVDRSGSMASVQAEAENGVNEFIKEQKKLGGECSVLLADFDSGPGNFRVVHEGDLSSCEKYTLSPRGMTALRDAIGRAIVMTGERLAALPEADRPDKVVFVVQTDGGENSSSEFTQARIKEMISEQTDKYSWEFVFLGMGVDTFEQGHQFGFANVSAVANTGAGYSTTYSALSANVSAYRSATVDHMAGMNIKVDDEGNLAASDDSGSIGSTAS